MTVFRSQCCPGARSANPRIRWPLLACVALSLAAGCREKQPPPPAKIKPPVQAKPDFEPQKLLTRPSDGVRAEMALKPGHWSSISLEAIANRSDAHGQLTMQLFGPKGMPLEVGLTPFTAAYQRPVVLAKGQVRQLETGLLCSPYTSPRQAFGRMLDDERHELFNVRAPTNLLPNFQWYFVVLAREPAPYRFLLDLDSVRAPKGDLELDERAAHYRVRLLAPGQRLELAPGA
ncbi:MAG TPA: hypothetical protein VHY20_07845, partial [Pirellulales bacterium]|nr:hypothetical protein [Pirellulales bacterium]